MSLTPSELQLFKNVLFEIQKDDDRLQNLFEAAARGAELELLTDAVDAWHKKSRPGGPQALELASQLACRGGVADWDSSTGPTRAAVAGVLRDDLVTAFPKASPPNRYIMCLVDDIVAMKPPLVALAEACQRLRRKSVWLPAISEVLDVLEPLEDEWFRRLGVFNSIRELTAPGIVEEVEWNRRYFSNNAQAEDTG